MGADEDALLTVLAYVRAALAFEHAPAAQRWERSQDVLRAAAAMDRVFGRRVESGTIWPVPLGASTALLEELELRVVAALARRSGGAEPMDAVEAAIIIARQPPQAERAAPGAPVVPTPRAVTTSAGAGSPSTIRSWGDLLGAYRRAFAADPPFQTVGAPHSVEVSAEQPKQPKQPKQPEQPNARLRFARWLVENNRVSDDR